jgi:F0F1-type ATP synthase assembly protein I
MPEQPLDPNKTGVYFALAQVGTEMAAPVALGLILDLYAGTKPWGTIGGAVFGLVGGIAHLVSILNTQQTGQKRPPR